MYINRVEHPAPDPKTDTKRTGKKHKDSAQPSFEDAIDTILSADAIEVVTPGDEPQSDKKRGEKKNNQQNSSEPPAKVDYTA